MKKLLIVGAIIALLGSCQKATPVSNEESVNITLSYSLDTSIGEDMTKSSDTELWGKFFNKIKNGEFVAPSYTLTFTEKKSGAKYVFEGDWESQDMVTIKTGDYLVTGTSIAKGNFISEKASLSFDTEVTIAPSQTSLTIPAKYDCFLIAFAMSDITSLQNHVSYESNMGGKTGESVNFYTFSEHYYAFSRKIYNSKYENESYIKGIRKSGATFHIYTSKIDFQKGKYYFYTDASSLYSLPEMEAGE